MYERKKSQGKIKQTGNDDYIELFGKSIDKPISFQDPSKSAKTFKPPAPRSDSFVMKKRLPPKMPP